MEASIKGGGGRLVMGRRMCLYLFANNTSVLETGM